MDVSKGFIIIINQNWSNVLSKNDLKFACLWLRRKTFKALSNGQPIFFVEKGTRLLRGYGIYKSFEVNDSKSTWNKFGLSCGATNSKDYLTQLNLPNEERGWSKEIGNILIEDINWLNKEILIKDINVYFPTFTVTGRTISREEVLKILSHINSF